MARIPQALLIIRLALLMNQEHWLPQITLRQAKNVQKEGEVEGGGEPRSTKLQFYV